MTTLRRVAGHSSVELVKLQPAVAQLPRERRNIAARAELVNRIRREFDDMPGLSITLPQAKRLFGLPQDVCGRIFSQLVNDGLLRLGTSGRYSLHS
jgi:hypothetical protein